MTIKSDNWIRRMAAEHEMINPFQADQVRHVNGQKIISYGTSSYGYDIRCSPEFSPILIQRLLIQKNLRQRVLWILIPMSALFHLTHSL